MKTVITIKIYNNKQNIKQNIKVFDTEGQRSIAIELI